MIRRGQSRRHTDKKTDSQARAQELRESQGGRPGLSVLSYDLTSLMVSVDVKQY